MLHRTLGGLLLCVCCVMLGLLPACHPSALRYTRLDPVTSPGVTTLQEKMSLDGLSATQMPPNAGQIALCAMGDSVFSTMAMYALGEIYWLDVYIANGAARPLAIEPDSFLLLDGNRNILRRLEPHEASNAFLADVNAEPAYQPKHNFVGRANSTDYIGADGNSTGMRSAANAVGTMPQGNPRTSGAAVVTQRHNTTAVEFANAAYAGGFVKGAVIPELTNGAGALYWLRGSGNDSSVRVKVANAEIEFRIPAPGK